MKSKYLSIRKLILKEFPQFSSKKGKRKEKMQDSTAKERMNTQKFISEAQLRINQKFTRNLEKYQQKQETVSSSFNNRISEVNEALNKYTSNTEQQRKEFYLITFILYIINKEKGKE